MTSAPPTFGDTTLRRARVAVGVCFFINAVLYANVVPRLPEIKADLGLSNSSLGAAVAAMPLGALVAGLSAAALMRRFGSARVATSGLVILALAVFGVAIAPNWPALAAAFLVAGALDAIVDVSQNAHGLRVQRQLPAVDPQRVPRHLEHRRGRRWPDRVGHGRARRAAGPAPRWHRRPLQPRGARRLPAMLPGTDDDRTEEAAAEAHRPAPTRSGARRAAIPALTALGVLAACGAFVEDAGASWSALYLRTELGAAAALAGLGFVALQVAMTVGRLTGDRVVDRFGQRRVVEVGGVLIAGGMGLALAVPSVATTLIGFALAGLGVATLIPAVYHAADELPGLASGSGLTVINWLLRIGFLVCPAGHRRPRRRHQPARRAADRRRGRARGAAARPVPARADQRGLSSA